ncbi:hypothetical protein UFOVP169_3 [uncultured Caudovirales phage]|uniref:Uncharacterized protein n=1 Tax=uncultured Caudovirales phage TaxID=2100421 RepID=A0A6J7WAC0_9CAUD|nr:hypothetical protein UFOVP169_3 [uncultured Caudovirales phage]
MSTTITAGNATTGLALSADNTGQLELKTGSGAGTTALTLSTSQIATFTGGVILPAGTATVAPLTMTAGTSLTSPAAGAFEFDGSTFFTTDDVTDGRGYVPSVHFFRLTSDGSAITTIANFFGTTSGMSLDNNIFYEVEAYLYFTKTTAGTATFTMTFTQAPVNNNALYVGTPVGGVGTAGTAQTAALVKSTATAGALPATGSLTTAVNHEYVLQSMFQANATTGGTLNLQVTSSAGSITPLTGSYFKVTRLPAANVGAFV